jgi:hypothetical protein
MVVLAYKSGGEVGLEIKDIFNIKSSRGRIIKLTAKHVIVRKGK